MTPRIFLSMIAIAFCAGCASITGGDTGWYAIGTRDGRLGVFPQDEYLQSRFGTSADRASYLRGWEDGFAQRPHPVS